MPDIQPKPASFISLEAEDNFLAYKNFPAGPRLGSTETEYLHSLFLNDISFVHDPRARAAGVIAVSHKFSDPFIAEQAGTARGTVANLRADLTTQGLVEASGSKPTSKVGGRPAQLFKPKPRFYSYIAENPEWATAAKLSSIAREHNMSQVKLIDSLINIAIKNLIKD